MSAWGPGSFENDSALDWADDLVEHGDIDFILSTLESALHNDLVTYGVGYVDTDTLDNAIAAAEVIAALTGKPSIALPQPINQWIQRHNSRIDNDTIQLAIQVLERALQTPALRDLWAEPTRYDLWKAMVEDLRFRLQL